MPSGTALRRQARRGWSGAPGEHRLGHLADHLQGEIAVGEQLEPGQTTPDGLFTLGVVECLGSCGTAPVLMVGPSYHENMSGERVDALLATLRATLAPFKQPRAFARIESVPLTSMGKIDRRAARATYSGQVLAFGAENA